MTLPDYSMCDMTVSVYHFDGVEVHKTVYERAFFDYKKVRGVDKTGSKDAMSFLLVIPGSPDIAVGDKVLLGEGPDIEGTTGWRSFIPAKVEGLCVVAYVDKKYAHGAIAHVEAGG